MSRRSGAAAIRNAVEAGISVRLHEDGTRFAVAQVGEGSLVEDAASGLTWQGTLNPEPMDWATAVSFCADLDYGGLRDWRLPNPTELSLVLFGRAGVPIFDNRTQQARPVGRFWTSITWGGDWGGSAYYVDFSTDWVEPDNKGHGYGVLCARDPA